jgi:hypothetical protein
MASDELSDAEEHRHGGGQHESLDWFDRLIWSQRRLGGPIRGVYILRYFAIA